ncbi:MAG: alpha/beta fold hydrolase [Sulfurifustaceae bacterium]
MLLDIEQQSLQGFDPNLSAANTARTEYVEIGRMRYAYRRFGRRSPVPILLLQRYRGTMDDWDPLFLDLLAEEREIILLDNAGVGLSTGKVPESIVGMAQNAAAFLDRLALRHVDVLGWSMGGCVAQQLALDRPKLVRRLILAGTGPGAVADGPKPSEKVFQIMLKPGNDDEDFLYLFFPETEQGRMEGLTHLRRLRQRREEPAPVVKSESFKAQAAALKSFSTGATATLPHLARLVQPVLVANGHGDVMIPAYNSYVMAQRLPNALLILYPNAGHGFLFQHAAHFSRQVLEFLAS